MDETVFYESDQSSIAATMAVVQLIITISVFPLFFFSPRSLVVCLFLRSVSAATATKPLFQRKRT